MSVNAETTLGFGHFIAQSDAVGKTLLAILVLMSVVSWVIIGDQGPDAGAAPRAQPRLPELLLERHLARRGGRTRSPPTARAIRSRT